jgi:hypothetical protein
LTTLSVRYLLIILLILGVSLSSILKIGISRAEALVSQNEASIDNQLSQDIPATVYVVSNSSFPQQNPLSFQSLSPTATVFVEQPSTPTPLGIIQVNAGSGMQAFVHAPTGLVAQPYVILTIFDSIPGTSIEIRGFENLREFVCTGSPCALSLLGSSTIQFSAYSASGGKSPEVIARVRVSGQDGSYSVVIDSVNQLSQYRDSCSNIWNVKDVSGASWLKFPESPFQLNTNKIEHLLAARLIVNGIVDAKDCPGGGMGGDLDYPTGCGIERAKTKMIEWQNQYDFKIWSTSLEVGVPPKILKSLIEYESQFWPSNQRFYLDEIGLGQINQLGLDVLLRQNPDFYNKICSTVFSDCSLPYLSLDPPTQALVRGAIINSIDATCASCANGIDLVKANQSIPVIAQLLKSNCAMVDLLDVAGKTSVEYDDLWKFTMATYHSGLSCVQDAITLTKKNDEPLDWAGVSPNLNCKGAKSYVDGFWNNLLAFDSYLADSSSTSLVQVAPTFLPTRTPISIPLPTEIPSKAKVEVRVYLDANGNGLPEKIELLDGISVELLLDNGEKLSAVTLNGKVIFDMTGYRPGANAIVSLPGLYREKLFFLPKDGVVQVDFVFTAPVIPNTIP